MQLRKTEKASKCEASDSERSVVSTDAGEESAGANRHVSVCFSLDDGLYFRAMVIERVSGELLLSDWHPVAKPSIQGQHRG